MTSTIKQPNAEQLAPLLVDFITRSTHARQVQIKDLRLLTGGASRQTWSFDARIEHTNGQQSSLPLILRSDPHEGPQSVMDRTLEFHVIEAVYAEGVLVPKPYFLGDHSLGVPFFIMERIEGETIPRRLFRDPSFSQARQVMAQQLGTRLARIHRVPIETISPRGTFRLHKTGVHQRRKRSYVLKRCMKRWRASRILAFELAFRWLRQHMPAKQERVLVHGDYRMGNVIFGPEGVRSILDWELAHIGDPLEDLGWMCVRSWRFGNDRSAGRRRR